MSSYLRSTRDFLYNRRRPFIVVGGVVGGVYMVANYAVSKITEMQTRMVEERRDRDNLKRRFAQNQEDCSFTILALLPTLGDQLFSHMDVEGLTAKLQRGRQSPAGNESITPAAPPLPPPKKSINGAFPALDAAAISSMDQDAVQSKESQQAMEEIWNKLGSSKEVKDEKTHLGNGSHVIENGQATANGAAVQADAELQAEKTGTTSGAHENASVQNGTSGLNAFSEPPPLPISPSARLDASPPPQTATEVEKEGSNGAITAGTSTAAAEGQSSAPVANGVAALDESHESHESSPPPKEPSPEELLAEKKQKLALWNELKITAFSRTITTLYSLVLLSLQTHIQLNLLGRYAYLTSVVSLSAPASSTHHKIRLERHDGLGGSEMEEDESFTRDDDEMAGGIDVQTERLYLTFSWWFLHEGWKELAEDVKEAVTDVFGNLSLKTQLTHQDFLLLLNKVRRRVEYEVREDGADTPDARSEWSEGTATTTARRRGKRRTFLSVLFPPTSQEIWTLEKAGAIPTTDPGIRHLSQLSPNLPTLLDETKDLLESSDFSRILRLSLSRVFQVFEETLRPTFGVEPAMPSNEVDGLLRQSSAAAAAITGRPGSSSALSSNNGRFQQLTDDGQAGVRVRLASLFPAVARQSSTAINGVPNEYVEALTEIKELKAFSAVIYSSWS